MKKKLKPIVVISGAPEWMATYSDMMSLLLTFFILLFSVADVKSEKVYEVYRSFQTYFNLDPRKVRHLGYYPIEISLSKIQGFLENSIRPPSNQGNRGRTKSYRDKVDEVDRFAALVEDRNNQLVVVPPPIFFEPGRASLTQEAYPQVLKVAAWIDRTNKDLKIVGHCSSLPLDADADAPDPIQLGYLRALTVARLLAGENGDLAAMAKRSEQGDLRLLAGKMKNIDFSRINLSTMGDFAPNAARRALWENPEIDDRVEVVPLPRLR